MFFYSKSVLADIEQASRRRAGVEHRGLGVEQRRAGVEQRGLGVDWAWMGGINYFLIMVELD